MPGPLWFSSAVNGEHLGSAGLKSGGDVQYQVYDDAGDACGTALIHINTLYKGNRDGVFAAAEYLACDNRKYHTLARSDNRGKKHHHSANVLYHFCTQARDACNVAPPPGFEILCVDKFRVVKGVERARLLKEMPCLDVAANPAGLTPAVVGLDDDDDDDHDSLEDEPASDKGRRHWRAGSSKDKRPGSGAVRKKFETSSEPTKVRDLEAELQDLCNDATPGSGRALSDKLAAVKQRLRLKESDPDEQRPSSKRKAVDVLADRVAQHRDEADQRRPHGGSSRGRDMERALGKVLRRSSRDSSHGSESEGSGDGGGSLRSKRDAFKKVARSQPGRLTIKTLDHFKGLLSSQLGETSTDSLDPVVLRFLLSCYLPANPMDRIGENAVRDLRTLAEAIDGLLRGRVLEVLDLLVMRMKAQMVAIKDKNTRSSRWLELIPVEMGASAVTQDEEELIRRVEVGEMKAEELLRRVKANAGNQK